MQLDGRVDNLVGSALFADGSGAMVVGQAPREGERPLFEMCKTASVIIPQTLDMMSWSAKARRDTETREQSGDCLDTQQRDSDSVALVRPCSLVFFLRLSSFFFLVLTLILPSRRELTSSGMAIGLGKEIPDAIYRYIDSFSAGMLSGTDAQQLHFAQCLWALHPGSGTHLSGRVGASCGGRSSRGDARRPTPGGRVPRL
jgi:hypothetical protein